MRSVIAFLCLSAVAIAPSLALAPPKSNSKTNKVIETASAMAAPMAASTLTAAALFLSSAQHASAAGVLDRGAKKFDANCAECHAAGKKLGIKEMSLKKEDMLNGPGLDQQAVEDYLKEEFPHKYIPFKMNPQGYTQVVSYVLDNAVNDKWDD